MPEDLVEKSRLQSDTDILIFFLPGKMLYNELSRRDRWMLRIGAMFAASKQEKEKMLAGYDNVKKEHLAAITLEIKKMLRQEQEPANRPKIGLV